VGGEFQSVDGHAVLANSNFRDASNRPREPGVAGQLKPEIHGPKIEGEPLIAFPSSPMIEKTV
jgi:hypothetical protein